MSDYPVWSMIFTDLDGVPHGEILDAHDREFNFSLHQPNTITFAPNLSASMTRTMLTEKFGLILLYRNRHLAMTAELSSIQTSGDESQHGYTCTFTETLYTRLSKRLLGKSAVGLQGPTTPEDQGSWLMDRLDALNFVDPTGLRDGNIEASGNISGGSWRYKPFLELMQELSATVNGFDFYVHPHDPAGDLPGITGRIEIAPIIGDTQENVIFGYGDVPDNARSYEWLVDTTQMIDRAFALPPSFPDSAGLKVASSEDSTAISTYGLREEVIPTDLNDYDLRTAMTDLHIALRKQPREQFVIQPSPSDNTKRVPQFLVDYDIGDTIRGRVSDQGLLLLDALVRVYGVKITLSDEGQETVDLTLINDDATSE